MSTSEPIVDLENSNSIVELAMRNNGNSGNEQNLASDTDNIDRILQTLAAQVPSPEVEQLKAWKREKDWLSCFQSSSRLLMAAIAWEEAAKANTPGNLIVHYGNDAFCRLAGIEVPAAEMSNKMGAGQKIRLLDLFQDVSEEAAEELYRRHILHLVLRDLYHIDLRNLRLLDEPLVGTLHSSNAQEPRFIEFWLTSDRLKVSRRNPKIDEFAELKLHKLRQEGKLKLTDALGLVASELPVLEQRLRLDNYEVE